MYLQTYGKAEKLVVFVGFLKVNDEKSKTAGYGSGSESIGQRHGSAQICTTMSRIHNTAITTDVEDVEGAFWCEAFRRGGKEKEGNKVKREQRKREEKEGILLCLLLASLRFFLARKESEASSLIRREEERKEKEMRRKGNRGRGRKRKEFCCAYFWPLGASSWRGKSRRPPASSGGCSGSSSRLSSR
jgi:hypothetical protein